MDTDLSATDTFSEESLAYVRRYYGVPANVGQRVYADGEAGEIVGGSNQYLLVKLDCESEPGRWHPTWRMGYVDDDDVITRFDHDE